MATHSRILAWRIPQTEEPRGLPSMGSRRVGHDPGTNTQKPWKVPLNTLFCGQARKCVKVPTLYLIIA